MDEDRLQYCINICWSCRDVSQKALYNYCLKRGDKFVDEAHVKVMTDSIQMCQTAADFMTRNSKFNDAVCEICAYICDRCADSCEKLNTEEMLHCAEMCRKCAAYCRGEV